jgi:Archaea bacterial proteins of unknown function
VNAVLRDIESDLDHLAAATYEDLCRQLVATGGLGPNRFGRVGRWWNRSDEMGRGVPTSRRHISLRERFSPETMWGSGGGRRVELEAQSPHDLDKGFQFGVSFA